MSKVAGAVAVVALLAAPGSVQAQETFFEGTTTGAFNGAPPASTASLAGLTFDGSTFNDFTSNKFVAFGGDPRPGSGGGNIDNFGSIYAAAGDFNYTGQTFQLLITFSSPTIIGSPTAIYNATLLGTITSTGNGGIFVDFLNSTQMFAYTDQHGTGVFTLDINDLSVNPNQAQSITGHITTAPEPATMALLATGLAGIAAARRRRKSA